MHRDIPRMRYIWDKGTIIQLTDCYLVFMLSLFGLGALNYIMLIMCDLNSIGLNMNRSITADKPTMCMAYMFN